MKKSGFQNTLNKSSLKNYLIGCAFGGMISMLAAGMAMASEKTFTANEWINMDKGPGVAQWVNEDGSLEEPGVRPNREDQETAETSAAENDQQMETETMASAEGEPAETEETSSERVIDPSKPMVALTFDDGPFAAVGNRIMDCLAQYGGKATFYVVGNRCASYKTEMERMSAEGHEIGNHTYEHKYLNKLTASQIQYQIQKGQEAILTASGQEAKTVRLPGGNKNATVLANVNAPIILWSIDTKDWKTKNAQASIDVVLSQVKDGDIILMHELYGASGDAAVQIIPALVERGYQLVTVSEMAQYRGGLENGKVYYSFRP